MIVKMTVLKKVSSGLIFQPVLRNGLHFTANFFSHQFNPLIFKTTYFAESANQIFIARGENVA